MRRLVHRCRRRLRVFLLVAVCVVCPAAAVFAYLHTALPRQRVRSLPSTLTSPIPTEQQQQQQQQPPEDESSDVATVVEVQSDGSFSDRVAAFNAVLSSLRAEELERRGTAAWKGPTSSELEVVSGARDDYLEVLSNYSRVTTVVLPWLNTGSR